MGEPHDQLPPPQRLALAYASGEARALLSWLLRFDARLSDIVGKATEPMIAQMKLAWWRDALSCDPGSRPKGEPLLQEYSRRSDEMATAAEQLVSAWEYLLVQPDWSPVVVAQFAEMRGSAVFAAFAPQHDGAILAREWAANDLRSRFPGRDLATAASEAAIPRSRAMRPLSILAMSVRNVSGPRLIWHALTGR